MKKRIENLEENVTDDLDKIIRFSVYPKWAEGEDVTDELEFIFRQKPEWKHKPPVSVGKPAFIFWDEFTGYEMKK